MLVAAGSSVLTANLETIFPEPVGLQALKDYPAIGVFHGGLDDAV